VKNQTTKLMTFKTMHEQKELLFLPNAWDLLSALILQQSGYKAIATTSWGVANAMGYKDGEQIEFKELLTLAEKMVNTLDIPVSIDIESGYSQNSDIIADNVLKLAEVGVSGVNFEDSLKSSSGLISVEKQCKLLKKMRSRLDSHGYSDFFINARIDTYFQLDNPVDETIIRANQYHNSGANGIFVPGLSQNEEIKQVVSAIIAPLNLMSLPNLTDVNSLNQLGVKRFSIGPSLSNATTAFIESSAREVLALQNTKSLYNNCEVKTVFR